MIPAKQDAVGNVLTPPLRASRRILLSTRLRSLRRQLLALKRQVPHPLSVRQSQQLVRTWAIKGGPEATFLSEVSHQSAIAEGPVLECGSGLTTIVAGLYARYGVWSLEHHARYRRMVMRSLQKCDVQGVVVNLAPLVSYGDFSWYSVPSELPGQFSFVICDGPPSETPGGRIGLMPILGSRLDPEGTVLLDDFTRPGEYEAINLWTQHYNLVVRSTSGRYAVLKR